MNIDKNQIEIIDAALLSASYFISDNIEAVCDDDYLEECENTLNQVNDALDLIRAIASNYRDGI